MKPPEYYRGREQTYLKHFFLERYLEAVAYHIGFFYNDFVYADCFSGPWKSEDEAFVDTSFMIAIRTFEGVREGLARNGKFPRMRHVFIEKDPQTYRLLEEATRGRNDVRTFQGEFEQRIPDLLTEIGRSFSLCFIDPTGWTGFAMNRIAPLLAHTPGEVIINFMFDHVQRFLEDPGSEQTFNEVFGSADWRDAVRPGADREDRIIRFYSECVRATGQFPYVTHTRILKPTADRTYFYLVYATRHPEGVIEFRKVEKKAVGEQEKVRAIAKQVKRIDRTGQLELLPAQGEAETLERERESRVRRAENQLRQLLDAKGRIEYYTCLSLLLIEPLVWESDVKDLILRLRDEGFLTLEGLKPRQRKPDRGTFLVRRL